jgi:DNA replication protein DnaC
VREHASFGEIIEKLRRETEARDAAECAELGITAEQLEARRDREREQRHAAEHQERTRQAREDTMERARNLPITESDIRAIAFDELETTEPLEAVRAWLATDVPLLVMAGSVGRGKTVAACWAVVTRNGRYMRARGFERLFAHRYGDEELAEQERVLRAGLVVVDDIGGREDSAEGLGSYLLDLVDERRHVRTKTILITNLPRKLFAERYPDPRLHSRLAQSATWAVTRGDDLRGSK